MKNSPFRIFLYFLCFWSIVSIPNVQAQDVSINILGSPATLPLSTTGSVQVDLCNTDPINISVPANKLNPQISVSSNVTILGVTNLDGSPLTNFTVLSNSGQIIRLANSVPLSNPNCLSFKVVIKANTIDTPGNVGGITAILNFQGSQTAGNNTFNDNSATSVAVVVNPALGPDLTPIVYLRPTLIYANSAISLVVDVIELNSIATSGVVTVKLTRDSKLSLNFDPTASLVGNRSVQNSAWSFSGSDPNYYILTSNQAITAGGLLSFGLNGGFNSGSTAGVFNVSAVVVGVVEELKITNNVDADKSEYFHQ